MLCSGVSKHPKCFHFTMARQAEGMKLLLAEAVSPGQSAIPGQTGSQPMS